MNDTPRAVIDSGPDDDFTRALLQVELHRPAVLKAPNHNDVRSFVHAWFAGFDHAAPPDLFLEHLDDADMTFNLEGTSLADDHASFRTWYADALRHIPWDFHDILDIDVTGVVNTGWTAAFFFRHTGVWHDLPLDDSATVGRPFNRVLRARWQLEHDGTRFLIRRYELDIAYNPLPL